MVQNGPSVMFLPNHIRCAETARMTRWLLKILCLVALCNGSSIKHYSCLTPLRGGRQSSSRSPPPKRSRRLAGNSPELKNVSPSMLSARKRPRPSSTLAAEDRSLTFPLREETGVIKVPKSAHKRILDKLSENKRASVQNGKRGSRLRVALKDGVPITRDGKKVVADSDEFSGTGSSDLVSDQLSSFDPLQTESPSPGAHSSKSQRRSTSSTVKASQEDESEFLPRKGEESLPWSADSMLNMVQAVETSVKEGTLSAEQGEALLREEKAQRAALEKRAQRLSAKDAAREQAMLEEQMMKAEEKIRSMREDDIPELGESELDSAGADGGQIGELSSGENVGVEHDLESDEGLEGLMWLVRLPKLGELAYIGMQLDEKLGMEGDGPVNVTVRIGQALRGKPEAPCALIQKLAPWRFHGVLSQRWSGDDLQCALFAEGWAGLESGEKQGLATPLGILKLRVSWEGEQEPRIEGRIGKVAFTSVPEADILFNTTEPVWEVCRGRYKGLEGSSKSGTSVDWDGGGPGANVVVLGLSQNATEKRVRAHFATCGKIRFVRLHREMKEYFATVEFAEPAALQKALQLNGTSLLGREIHCLPGRSPMSEALGESTETGNLPVARENLHVSERETLGGTSSDVAPVMWSKKAHAKEVLVSKDGTMVERQKGAFDGYAIAREELPPRWWWEIRVERTSSRREILGGMQALPRPALNDID